MEPVQKEQLDPVALRKALTPEQINEFKQAFNLFDKDMDGWITVDELETVLRSLGQTPSKDELASMVNEVDPEGKAQINQEQLYTMIAVKMASTQDEIAECFKYFDKDSDSFIEAAELKQVMESLGEPLSMNEITEMIKALDTNNKGKVSYAEFKKMAQELKP